MAELEENITVNGRVNFVCPCQREDDPNRPCAATISLHNDFQKRKVCEHLNLHTESMSEEFFLREVQNVYGYVVLSLEALRVYALILESCTERTARVE